MQNIMNFYKTLVRPILDYGSAVWNPYQKQDTSIENIEKVQARATKRNEKPAIQGKIKKVRVDDSRSQVLYRVTHTH